MKRINKKGFTLVELLVVIAIIGILAIVAVPALFKNIEKGKVADLEGDISAIRSAVLSYYSDESDYPVDGSGSIKNPPIFTSGGTTGLDGNDNKGSLAIFSELEGLSFPFKGSYKLTDNTGSAIATAPLTLYITITLDSNSTISDNGLEKIAKDLGLALSKSSETGSSTTVTVKGSQIIIPLINK